MKNKITHIKILSLLVALAMVFSSVMVFAEGEAPADESAGDGAVEVTVDGNEALQAKNNQPLDEVPIDDEDESTSDDAEDDPAVELMLHEASVVVGTDKALSATLSNEPADTTVEWTWTSDNPDIATVSADGVVTGVAVSETPVTITVTVTITGTEFSATVSDSCAVTVIESTGLVPATPAKVTAATRYGKSDNGLTVKWTSTGENTEYYQVLRGTSSDVTKMKVVPGFEQVDSSKREAYWLEDKGTFYYAVKAVSSEGTEAVSAASAKLTISGKILTKVSGLVWYGKTKKKTTIYKTSSLKKGDEVTVVPKGAKVIAVGKYPKKVAKFKQPSKVQVQYTANGQKYTGWLKWSQLNGGVKGATDAKNDYTRSVKEDYVNGKGFTSAHKYLVWVSPHTQRAYVFKGGKGKWKLYKTFRVNTGRFSGPTKARHTTIIKKKARAYQVNPNGRRYYFKNASYFYSGVSFHTGTWWADNNHVKGKLNTVGKPNTFGCIRMANKDATWIYKNVAIGSAVIVTQKA